MRPFKFFFAFSLGILIFLFFARFLILAAIAAAVLSFVFFVFRKIRYFFQDMTWEERGHYYHHHYRRPSALPEVRYEEEPLFYHWEKRPESLGRFREVEIR